MEDTDKYVTKKRFNATMTTVTLMIIVLTSAMTGYLNDTIGKLLFYFTIILLVVSAIYTRKIIKSEGNK